MASRLVRRVSTNVNVDGMGKRERGRERYAVSVEVHFSARTGGGIVAAFAVDDEGFELWVGWWGCG